MEYCECCKFQVAFKHRKKWGSYVREKPPPHTEWSILTEINRVGYQDEIFIQSPLSTYGSESKSVCCQKRFICVSWCIFKEAMRNSILKAQREREMDLCFMWALVLCRIQTVNFQNESADSAEMNHITVVLQFWGTSVNFSSPNKCLLSETSLKATCIFFYSCSSKSVLLSINIFFHYNTFRSSN